MCPEGRIYDMQANFIGTANTQGLEEMGDGGADGNQAIDPQNVANATEEWSLTVQD